MEIFLNPERKSCGFKNIRICVDEASMSNPIQTLWESNVLLQVFMQVWDTSNFVIWISLNLACSRLPDSREDENNFVGKASKGALRGIASTQAPTHFSHAFFFSFPTIWHGTKNWIYIASNVLSKAR